MGLGDGDVEAMVSTAGAILHWVNVPIHIKCQHSRPEQMFIVHQQGTKVTVFYSHDQSLETFRAGLIKWSQLQHRKLN